jgi:hypothetical protein
MRITAISPHVNRAARGGGSGPDATRRRRRSIEAGDRCRLRAEPRGAFCGTPDYLAGLGPTRLDGLPARPCGLVEGLHLVIGEQAVGVVHPHVLDDPVELARACDGDSVGDVVG